jgi:sortase A
VQPFMQPRIRWRLSLSQSTRSVLRSGAYLFLALGFLVLGYCAYVLLGARLYQAYESWQFQEAASNARPPIAAAEPAANSPGAAAATSEPSAPLKKIALAARPDFPLGRIEIARIGLAAMIMEGVDAGTLRHSVGHIPRTPLPGQQGNVALAGHRDTFFRPLRNIQNDDEITLTTLDGSYRYRVDLISIVEPRDVGVLKNTGENILTLVTCYPFHFIGSAPQRFIVRAHRIPE